MIHLACQTSDNRFNCYATARNCKCHPQRKEAISVIIDLPTTTLMPFSLASATVLFSPASNA